MDFTHCPPACAAEGQHVCSAEALAELRAEYDREFALWKDAE